jgi:DNA polymerase IIIc chi subunit
LNELGKELLSNQLVSHILSILKEDKSNPIILGWYGKNPQINDSLIVKSAHTPIKNQPEKEQMPKHNRKLPVTRRDDFLWEM